MLDKEALKSVVASAPVVSIDLRIVHNDYRLKRKLSIEPLERCRVASDGCVLKSERWQNGRKRVANAELRLSLDNHEYMWFCASWRKKNNDESRCT